MLLNINLSRDAVLNEEIYFNQRCATISYFRILNSGWELETASFYNMTQNGLIRVGIWSIRYPCVNRNNDTQNIKEVTNAF